MAMRQRNVSGHRRRKRPKKPQPSAEALEMLQQICEAIRKMGIVVRMEEGHFRGGLCRLEGQQQVLFLNKKHRIERQIRVALEALKELDHEKIYLAPSIREMLKA